MALGMKRSVRLKPYVIIGPEFWMKVEVVPDEDVDLVLAELKADVITTLDDLEAEEAAKREKKEGFLNRILSYFDSPQPEYADKAFRAIMDLVQSNDPPEYLLALVKDKMEKLTTHNTLLVRERAVTVLGAILNTKASPDVSGAIAKTKPPKTKDRKQTEITDIL